MDGIVFGFPGLAKLLIPSSASKTHVRRAKNRESAARSRLKKKEYLQSLERKVYTLLAQNKELRVRLNNYQLHRQQQLLGLPFNPAMQPPTPLPEPVSPPSAVVPTEIAPDRD